ncbi:MAG: MarR family transcriptional regulator [Capsulimonadaceae bacterium]|nr:MarR family transcriptional regulator [Capsulimonadaceae bacterium]
METPANMRADDRASIATIEQILPDLATRFLGRTLLEGQFAQLPLAQFRLVKSLPDDDTGETMGRLSVKLSIRGSALTQAADRAIRQGLVERISDPSDRRIVRLRLTAQGIAWIRERKARRRARLEVIWQAIDVEERAALLDAIQTLDRIGRQAAALLSAAELDGSSADERSVLPAETF